MTNMEIILSTVVGVIVTAITTITSILGKKNKQLFTKVKEKNFYIDMMITTTPKLIKIIEQAYPQGHGELKKEYCIETAKSYFVGNNIPFDVDFWDNYIKMIVEFINYKSKNDK